MPNTESTAADDRLVAARVRPGGVLARLWTGVTGSAVGDGMSAVAVPLLASTLTRDPSVIALVSLFAGLPWLLFGLAGGALADRMSRRKLMLTADVVRLAVVAALALMVAAGAVGIPTLLAVVFLLGSAQTVFSSAYPAFVPQVVGPDRLSEANARLMMGATIGRSFVGGMFGAALFAAASWLPFLIDSASFGVSALCLFSLAAVPVAAPRAAAAPARRQIVQGLSWVARSPLMRVLAAVTALLTVGTAAMLGVFVLYVQRTLQVPNLAYGAFMAVYAAGSLAGAAVGPRVVDRLGLLRTAQLAATAGAVAFTGLGLSRRWWLAGLFLLVLGVATMSWNISAVTLRQRVTPDGLLGRVSSVFALLAMGAAPVGAPVGGLVAKLAGLSAPALLAAVLATVASVLLWWRHPGGTAPAGARADGSS